jgi:hypothetical protein
MYSVTNVATIDETGQSDDATATVNCYQLDVNKDATTFFTRTYEWTIDKSVVPGEWRLFDGETGTSQYTIDIVKTGFTDSDWSVEGEIVIDNPNPARSADLTAVVDNISGVGAATVDCPSLVVAAGGSLTCDYSAPLPDGSDRLNTATATQQNYDFASDGSATADGTTDYSGQADVLFGDPTTEVNKEIDVDDTNGGSWHFAGSGSVSYEMVFDCSDVTFENLYGMYTHDNTAEIVQTGQDSSASVTTHCYQLDVTKDAQTYLTRTYEWTIDKVVDNPGPITVAAGESVVVNYTVTVDVLGFTDSDWAVDGDIDIYNPNPQRAAELTAVLDLISPDIAAGVDCGGETSVPAGGTLTCSYDASLPDAASRTNTATATQQLYDLFYDGTSTPDGTMDYSGQAAVDFASAIVTEVDEQVDVSDSYLGFLGTVHYSEAPKTFEYPRTITAPLDQCGNFQVDNLATFVANDTGATGSDDASVVLYVPCEGCTPGFWQGGYGADLWNTFPDPDWAGADPQPYYHDTLFNDHFTAYGPAAGFTMFDLVSTGGGSDDWQKAARDVVAGTLNASWGMAYPYTPQEIKDMWTAAVNSGDFAGLHATLAPANELGCPIP